MSSQVVIDMKNTFLFLILVSYDFLEMTFIETCLCTRTRNTRKESEYSKY